MTATVLAILLAAAAALRALSPRYLVSDQAGADVLLGRNHEQRKCVQHQFVLSTRPPTTTDPWAKSEIRKRGQPGVGDAAALDGSECEQETNAECADSEQQANAEQANVDAIDSSSGGGHEQNADAGDAFITAVEEERTPRLAAGVAVVAAVEE